MSVEHPLIGISGQWSAGESPALRLPLRYAESVLKAGGVPVALPPIGGPRDIVRSLAALDGLLFPGGDDFDTARLGLGPTHPRATPVPAEQQDFDFELARGALERELPVLGICYGMQLLALSAGARLHQHVPDDRPGAREHSGGARHPVVVRPGSKLARIVGVEPLEVVSRHHQALASPGPRWSVCATDDEDLIEAVELDGAPFALGVQWHPELAPEGSRHDRLFRALVGAAGVAAGRRAYGGLRARPASGAPGTRPGARRA